MPNRLVRDQIILEVVEMVNLGNFRTATAPHGVVLQHAPAIGWLQYIVDFYHHTVPFSSTVKLLTPLPCIARQDYLTLPDDFIVDMRNGYVVQTIPSDTNSLQRTHRVSSQKFLTRKLWGQRATNITYPIFYNIVGKEPTSDAQRMVITPTPTINTVGYLCYYALPPVMAAGDKPGIPNADYICTEYVRIRAMEWANLYEPGTAQKFTDKLVVVLKAGGLLNEPEDDDVPFDDLTFIPGSYSQGYDVFSMMGPR
jgi:hypothetical protein